MNCNSEPEVLEAVMDGRFPDGCEVELREHVASCDDCADLVLVAGVIREDHHEAVTHANVPPPSVVWWRIQRRARAEAVQAATRAITAVQTGAIAAAVIIGAALIGGVGAWLAHISDGIHFGAFDFAPAPEVVLLASAGACLMFAPVALWVLVARD